MVKLGAAFISLFLDKKARESRKNKPQHPISSGRAKNEAPSVEPPHPSPEDIYARLEQSEQAMGQNKSPERQQLIQKALRIRAAQATVLDDLSDEQKNKLHDLAVQSLLAAVRAGDDR